MIRVKQRSTSPSPSIGRGGRGVERASMPVRAVLRGGLLLLFLILLVSCTDSTDRDDNTIILASGGWNGSYLPTYVLKLIFEQELGHKVEIADKSTIPAAFEAVASGEADIFTSAWFPTRDVTFDKHPNLIKIGQVYGGKAQDAYEGWMVSAELAKAHQLTHVSDLVKRSVVRALDHDGDGKGNLIGCPNSWACAQRLPEILENYGLAALYEIEEVDSEQDMLANIEARLRKGQSALFYMYQPAAFPGDIPITERALWLQGTEAYLPLAFNRAVVTSEFLVKHPEAAKILNEYQIPGADIGEAMQQIGKKGDSARFLTELAQKWIDEHRAEVDSWLEGIGERSESSQSSESSTAPRAEPLTVAYSPEKEELFLKLVIEFNRSRPPEMPRIHPIRLDMADMLRDAQDGRFAAISPDSSIWLNQLDRTWQQKNPAAAPLVGYITRYAISPIVIAMWESQAAEMGYPDQPIGWQALMEKASTDKSFKWSHHSAATASGLLATTAEFYAGAGKLENLTKEDLEAEATIEYVKTIEATVERYGGESEDRVVIRMLAEGGHPLDAFVAQEQLVIYFNRNTPAQEKLVAIYPQEGTFWMDHPLVLLDGSWVTQEQRDTFREFAKFVVQPEQQRLVLQEGYRPGEVAHSLQEEGSLIKAEYGVDPKQPKTLLQVPSAGVLSDIREVWRLTKKPANIYLVADISGSMEGEKLKSAKGALLSFIDQIQGKRDRVALLAFSDDIYEIEPLERLDNDHRESFKASIQQLESKGGTMLYDAVAHAFKRLQQEGDPERINVIVAMTDGMSQGEINVLESQVRAAKTPVLIFTVGYGEDADLEILQRIARLGDGQVYPSDPETIKKLYELLSAFF